MAAKTASLSVNIIADAAKARAGLKEAETAFGKFRREVGEAQGAMGKFKTIGGAALDSVKANAVAFASGAAAAIGTFVIKSVNAFQDLALSAGKFADATGLSSEEASRFIEVVGDIGVEAATVEKSIGFMNKTLGNSPELFEKLGVQIAYAADGSKDINGTFLNVVDRLNEIKDPAQRAATATKLLGRGWMELAELVGMGADELAASLASVSDAKVISQEELQKARDYRAATDNLKDAWEDFSLQIGQAVVPALTDTFELLNNIYTHPIGKEIFGEAFFSGGLTNVQKLDGALRDFIKQATGVGAEIKIADDAFDGWKVGLEGGRGTIDQVGSDIQKKLNDRFKRGAELVSGLTQEWRWMLGQIDKREAFANAETAVKKFEETFKLAMAGNKKAQEALNGTIDDGKRAIAQAMAQADLIPPDQEKKIRFLTDTGRLDEALRMLQLVDSWYRTVEYRASVTPSGMGSGRPPAPAPPPQPAPRPVTTTRPPALPPARPPVRPASSYGGPTVTTTRIPGLAGGGTLTSSGLAMVGENGPELVNLPRGASVIPSIPSRKMMGGGTVYNITLQAGLVSNPDQVGQEIIEAIRRAERRSGKVFASA